MWGCLCRATGRSRKGTERGVAEKKAAILEAALKHHPGSDRLLLALLDCAEAVAAAPEVLDRWHATA